LVWYPEYRISTWFRPMTGPILHTGGSADEPEAKG
jgi:hypothetical protein